MKAFLSLFAAVLGLLASACAPHPASPSLEGRWRVQMSMRENWSQRYQPLSTEATGELIFDRRLPDLPSWDRQEYLGPRESGCSYLPINGFYGDTAYEPHSFDAAARCVEAIGHRSESDSVWVGINTRFIDAGTFLRGVLERDTVRGSWLTGSESLRQGGSGVFLMWRVSDPPRAFTRTVRRVQFERFSENTIGFSYGFFQPDPGHRASIWWGAVLLAGFAAIAWVTGGRRRWIGVGMVGAAAFADVLLTLAGGALVLRLQDEPDFPRPIHGAQIGGLLLAVLVVVPALLAFALRWNARRNLAERGSLES